MTIARARVQWELVHGSLPAGVILSHQAMVAGWQLRAELVMNNIGLLQIRLNGANVGAPLGNCTMSQGRRHYLTRLKHLGRPRQMTLPI